MKMKCMQPFLYSRLSIYDDFSELWGLGRCNLYNKVEINSQWRNAISMMTVYHIVAFCWKRKERVICQIEWLSSRIKGGLGGEKRGRLLREKYRWTVDGSGKLKMARSIGKRNREELRKRRLEEVAMLAETALVQLANDLMWWKEYRSAKWLLRYASSWMNGIVTTGSRGHLSSLFIKFERVRPLKMPKCLRIF